MLKGEVNHYQFLFFGGILGEILELPFVGNYLKENKKILSELGIKTVHHHTLSSMKSAHTNSQTILDLIQKYYKKNRKPIILFCHSKGCLEVLLAIGEDLKGFKKCVHKIICVQPPFQGASVTDFVGMKQLSYLWPGLFCLKKNYYTEKLENDLVNDQENHAYLQKHVLVIRGHHPYQSDVSWIIRPSHFFLKNAGASDGLVHLADQAIPEAKYHQITLEMDHSDLFTSNLLSNKSNHFRRELMAKLINWAIGPDEEREKLTDEILIWAALQSKMKTSLR